MLCKLSVKWQPSFKFRGTKCVRACARARARVCVKEGSVKCRPYTLLIFSLVKTLHVKIYDAIILQT